MGRKAIDMTGQRVGRLTVLERAGSLTAGLYTVPAWRCRCDCGNEVIVRGLSLRSGNTTSCGCLHREISAYRMTHNNPMKDRRYR